METWSLALNQEQWSHLFSRGGSAVDHSRQALSLSPAPDDTYSVALLCQVTHSVPEIQR